MRRSGCAQKIINVCIRIGKGKKAQVPTTVFGTFTADLERLREFLRVNKVRHWLNGLMLLGGRILAADKR